LHAIAIALIGAFLVAGWWQYARASGGNLAKLGLRLRVAAICDLRWGLWVRMVRDELRGDDPQQEVPEQPASWRHAPLVAVDDEEDEELAAYNRRLARLNDEG